MNHDSSNILMFLGRFHVLLVHLPIGGLVLLGFLELLAVFTRWKDAAKNNLWILSFVSGTAVITAACGWMLARGGGYDQELLKWHRIAGLTVTGACLITLLFRSLKWNRVYRLSLGATLFLLAVASHLGGSITHGRDFLTRYAPGHIKAFVTSPISRQIQVSVTDSELRKPVFVGVIQPILRQCCSECHGPEKHKGGLRLDTYEGLLTGGDDGQVIMAGHAKDSVLIRRLKLPVEDDDHMPPEGKLQPTSQQIELLERWIDAGAPVSERVADLKSDARTRSLIEAASKLPVPTN